VREYDPNNNTVFRSDDLRGKTEMAMSASL
jgi:hypothetical protein